MRISRFWIPTEHGHSIVNQTRSLSRNSPFNGWQMKGKAVATIVGGEVVYEDRS